MDNIKSNNDLLNLITFERIIDFFKGKLLSSNQSFWSYEFIHNQKPNIYHFFYETNLSCYSESDLRCLSTTELLYNILEKHHNDDTIDLIEQLSNFNSSTHLGKLNTTTPVSITNSILKLIELTASHKNRFSFPLDSLLERPFTNKVFLHENKIAFPLSLNNTITNILLYDGTEQSLLNNNTGVFASLLPHSPNYISVFFNAGTMLKHKAQDDIEDVFYLLFGISISYLQIEKLIALSKEKNKDIKLFSELKHVDNFINFFNLLQVYISHVHTIFDSMYLQVDQSKFTLFFSAINVNENYLPLIEYINKINRAIIFFYNGEIPTASNDITIQQDLIKIESWKDTEYIRLSITFPKNMEVLFLVFNTILKSLKKDFISFNIIK